MSNISDRHNVNSFVAGKSAPLTGQRLAKVGYKTTKKQKAKFPNVCVSIPFFDATSQEFVNAKANGKFDSIILSALESAQDGIIRSLYESSDGSLSSVSDSEISLNACIAFMAAEATGGRMTKEFLESWFVDNLSDNLSVALAERTSLEIDDPKITTAVNGFKVLISGLSGGKTLYAPEQIVQLQKALELTSCDDDVQKRLVQRLERMSQKPEVLLTMNL